MALCEEPVAQGRERLQLVSTLRESKVHPTLDQVFERMQYELSTSIDIVENPLTWGPWGRLHHLALAPLSIQTSDNPI